MPAAAGEKDIGWTAISRRELTLAAIVRQRSYVKLRSPPCCSKNIICWRYSLTLAVGPGRDVVPAGYRLRSWVRPGCPSLPSSALGRRQGRFAEGAADPRPAGPSASPPHALLRRTHLSVFDPWDCELFPVADLGVEDVLCHGARFPRSFPPCSSLLGELRAVSFPRRCTRSPDAGRGVCPVSVSRETAWSLHPVGVCRPLVFRV